MSHLAQTPQPCADERTQDQREEEARRYVQQLRAVLNPRTRRSAGSSWPPFSSTATQHSRFGFGALSPRSSHLTPMVNQASAAVAAAIVPAAMAPQMLRNR